MQRSEAAFLLVAYTVISAFLGAHVCVAVLQSIHDLVDLL